MDGDEGSLINRAVSFVRLYVYLINLDQTVDVEYLSWLLLRELVELWYLEALDKICDKILSQGLQGRGVSCIPHVPYPYSARVHVAIRFEFLMSDEEPVFIT